MGFNPYIVSIDKAKIGGQWTPGIATVKGHGSPREWEELKGYGATGSVLRFMGRRLAEFDVICELTTNEDWVDWEAFRPIVLRPPFRTMPKALEVKHPWLAMHGIVSAVVLNCIGPEQPNDAGPWIVTIKLKEYRRLKVSYAKPEETAPKPETDPVERYIDQLTTQFKAKLNG